MSNKDIFIAAQNLVEVCNFGIDEKLGNELIQFKNLYNKYETAVEKGLFRN